jgi:hypothetical protein
MLKRLWARFNRIQAPVLPESIGPAPGLEPQLATERYADVNAQRTQQQDARHEFLAYRVCAINNANVVRHYGTHVVDESRQVRQLDAQEQKDVDRLIEPKYHTRKLGEISPEMKRACHLAPRD